jgi:hypothetical protein
MLKVSWSPGASAAEQKVVSDGVATATFNATGSNRPGEGWFVDKYPLVEHSASIGPLPFGAHTINFEHTKGDGTFWDWIRLSKPCEQDETAWGDGTEFPGSNWATYFTYTVQGTPTCPAITDTTGSIHVLDIPLDDVRRGQSVSDTPQVFAEYAGTDHGGFDLDINADNQTNVPDGYSVAAGTPICSYYVHFDDGVYDDPYDTAQGTITFESDVIGLIVAGTINTNDIFNKAGINTLCDTNSTLGNDGTIYAGSSICGIYGEANGLEIFNSNPTLDRPNNQDPVDISDNTVGFDLLIANKHDAFRIILPALP